MTAPHPSSTTKHRKLHPRAHPEEIRRPLTEAYSAYALYLRTTGDDKVQTVVPADPLAQDGED